MTNAQLTENTIDHNDPIMESTEKEPLENKHLGKHVLEHRRLGHFISYFEQKVVDTLVSTLGCTH